MEATRRAIAAISALPRMALPVDPNPNIAMIIADYQGAMS